MKTQNLILTIIYLILLGGALIYIFTHKSRYVDSNLVEKLSSYDTQLIPSFRVVISLTTIPSRTQYIEQTVNRLKNQLFKPDAIYVCVPEYSKRMKKPYVLPSNINVDNGENNVKIVRCKDYGPATKLLGCIPYENDPNTLIITVDDDQTYTANLVQTLVKYAIKYPDYAIGTRAMCRNMEGVSCDASDGQNVLSPDTFFLEGFGGVAYRRKFISQPMLDYFEGLTLRDSPCFISDDLTISTWLEKQGIKRLKLCEGNTRNTVGQIHKNNPLNQEHRVKTYRQCVAELDKLV